MHFREEEEVVFPLVIDETEAQPVLAHVMMDHLRIHALVRTLRWELESRNVNDETMTNVVSATEEHIRFEENSVFPMIERLLPEEMLGAVSLAPRNRTYVDGKAWSELLQNYNLVPALLPRRSTGDETLSTLRASTLYSVRHRCFSISFTR